MKRDLVYIDQGYYADRQAAAKLVKTEHGFRSEVLLKNLWSARSSCGVSLLGPVQEKIPLSSI
jgi:hypothetical protein